MARTNLSITWILIIICSIVFLVTLPFQSNENFIRYAALQPDNFMHGQYVWTIVTNMFMHASPGHLIMNMLSLIFIGGFLERVIGKRRFLLFYLLAGIFAGLIFVFLAYFFGNTEIGKLLFSSSDAYAVGASGAIFGIAALLAVLTPKLPVYIMFIPIATPMWLAVIIILGVMWLFSVVGGLAVGNTAHLGGALAGLIYGFYIRHRYGRRVRMLNKMLVGK